MASLYCSLTYWLLSDPHGPTYFHLILIGSVYGALTVCVFATARRFVRHEASAYFAAFLVLASPPLLATSWIFLAGLQALVPLLIYAGPPCYWRIWSRA